MHRYIHGANKHLHGVLGGLPQGSSHAEPGLGCHALLSRAGVARVFPSIEVSDLRLNSRVERWCSCSWRLIPHMRIYIYISCTHI